MLLLILHHNDLDGIASAAIVYKYMKTFFETIITQAVQYGDTWDPELIARADATILVDFSFPNMYALAIACNYLVWIDHHETVRTQQQDAWYDPTLFGIRSVDLSACELTWNCYFPGIRMPNAIKWIGDRDTWKFNHNPQTNLFCAAAFVEISDPEDPVWNDLLHDGPKEQEMLEIGASLLGARQQRIEHAVKHGARIRFEGLNALIVNATEDISELGEYIYKKLGYELAIIYSIDETFGVRCSLRTNQKSINCAEIAQKFGGGGHPGAAGFRLNDINGLKVLLGI